MITTSPWLLNNSALFPISCALSILPFQNELLDKYKSVVTFDLNYLHLELARETQYEHPADKWRAWQGGVSPRVGKETVQGRNYYRELHWICRWKPSEEILEVLLIILI